MNRPPPKTVFPAQKTLRIPGFDISWVGSRYEPFGLYLGSDDGRILELADDASWLSPPQLVSDSESAISGAAVSKGWFAASSAREVNLIKIPAGGGMTDAKVVPHGAHGISALPSGGFVAPMGLTGIMFARPHVNPADVTVRWDSKNQRYFYRTIAIPGPVDMVICACRTNGVGVMPYSWEKNEQTLSTWTEMDVVDVCWIGNELWPGAVAFVGMDGTIGFIRDVFGDKRVTMFKYQTVRGRAYRIMTANGHLFVLTSRGVYMAANVVDQFLTDKMTEGRPTFFFVMEAGSVDANILQNKWLYLIMADELRGFDIEEIHLTAPKKLHANTTQSEPAPAIHSFAWNEGSGGIVTTGRQLDIA